MMNPPPSFHPGGDKPLPYEGKKRRESGWVGGKSEIRNPKFSGGWMEIPNSDFRIPNSLAHWPAVELGFGR